MPEQRKGLAYGVAGYLIWGIIPLFWKLIDQSGAVEILAQRIVWSVLTIALLVFATRRVGRVRELLRNPRSRRALMIGAVLVSINWGTFIWGVNNGRVVETSLGYFITPLFTVLLGVIVLHERLRVAQWIALGIAFVAVIGLAIENGRPPWVAIILTLSFGCYGLAKKQAGAGAVEGMAIESATMAPLAVITLLVLAFQGHTTVTHHGPGYLALVVLTGPVTAVPLLLFGSAATRIPMTTLGLLNYITPIMQFALGVLFFHEAMSPLRWAGFALVWLALAIFTTTSLTTRRHPAPLQPTTTPA